jgi:hypothetical protein
LQVPDSAGGTGVPQQAGDAMGALTQALTHAPAHRERTEPPAPEAGIIATAKPALGSAANEVAPIVNAQPAPSPPVTGATPEASDDAPLASLPGHQSADAGNAETPALAPSPAASYVTAPAWQQPPVRTVTPPQHPDRSIRQIWRSADHS